MMMVNNVPYANLRQVLLRLGFTEHTVPTSHHYFKHEASGVVILLPLYSEEEIVAARNLIAVRGTVDDWDIADRETFERMLSESINPGTPTEPELAEAAA